MGGGAGRGWAGVGAGQGGADRGRGGAGAGFTYPRDVLLTQHVLLRLDLLGRLGDPDAATLTPVLRLQDVGLVFLLSGVRLQVSVADAQTPALFTGRHNKM